MTVYAKNHQSLHKIYKFGSVSKLFAMTVCHSKLKFRVNLGRYGRNGRPTVFKTLL
jgi:hypothetical protein